MAGAEVELSSRGVDEVVAQLARATQALENIGSAAGRSAPKTKQAGDEMRRAGAGAQSFNQQLQAGASRIQGAASAVTALTGALGGGNGASRASGLIGTLAGAVAQGAALGATFGPTGAVVGAIVGAVTVVAQLASAHRDAAAAAQEQREAVNALVQTMRTFAQESGAADAIASAIRDPRMASLHLTQFDDAALTAERQRRIAQAQEIQQRVGEEDIAATRRMMEQNRANGLGTGMLTFAGDVEQLDAAREALAVLDQEAARREQAALATRDQAEALARQAAAQAEVNREEEEAEQRHGRRREAAQKDRTVGEMGEFFAQAIPGVREPESLGDDPFAIAAASGEVGDWLGELASQMDPAIEAARELADSQDELANSAKQAEEAFGRGYVSSIDEVIRQWRELQEAANRAGRGMISQSRLLERSMVAVGNNIAETIGGTMKGAFEDALGAWLDGSKSFVEAAEDMVKGVLKALTIESIVQAVTEVARGISAAARQDWVAAPQHFAAAAAWAAVGVVAGGVGAAVGAFGGGGGADKGGASQGADNRDLSSRAVQERQSDQPMVINVYPAFATEREVQRFVYGGLNGGAREGMRIDSRAIRGVGR